MFINYPNGATPRVFRRWQQNMERMLFPIKIPPVQRDADEFLIRSEFLSEILRLPGNTTFYNVSNLGLKKKRLKGYSALMSG